MDRFITTVMLWAILVSLPSSSYSQTRQEVYELDVFSVKSRGSSEVAVTQYFIGLGMDELRLLRNRERSYGLDEQSLKRRKALDEALAPINAIDALSGTPAFNSELEDERMRLAVSSELSEKVFKAIGGERAREKVLEMVVDSIRSISNSKKENAFSANAPLLNPTLALLLNLTDDQSSELKALHESATKKSRFGSVDAFKEMERLLERHWNALRASLDIEQRKQAEDLIGEPLQWFRGLPSNGLRKRDFSGGGVSYTGTKAMELQNSAQRHIHFFSEEEMQQRGVQMIHGHFCEMINSNFIMGEIELVKDQRKELRGDFREYLKTETAVIPNRHEARLSQILESEADYPGALKDILTSLQLDSLENIEFQVLTGKFESSFGLLHPKVLKHLQIDPKQTEKIRELCGSYEMAYSELVPEIDLARDAIFDSLKNDMFKVLNVDQQERYREIFANE